MRVLNLFDYAKLHKNWSVPYYAQPVPLKIGTVFGLRVSPL